MIQLYDQGIIFYGDDAAETGYVDRKGASLKAQAVTTSYKAGATINTGNAGVLALFLHIEYKGDAPSFTVKVEGQYVDVQNPTLTPAWGWFGVQSSLQNTGAAGLPEETAMEHVIAAPADGSLVLDALILTTSNAANGNTRVSVKASGALAAGDFVRVAGFIR